MLCLRAPVIMNPSDALKDSSSSFIISGFEVIYFLICLDWSAISNCVDFESQIHFFETSQKIK